MKKMLILLLASLSTGLMCCGGEPPKVPELDRFGGWKAKSFEATGFFRTQHDGERWWLVTPEGNAFLSLGINHYHPGWWMQNENRDHWVKVFGAKQPGDAAWRRGFRDEAVRDCRHLGLNTFGYHCETPILLDPPLGPVMPYVRHYVPVSFSLHMRAKPDAYVDVFAPSFAERCDRVAREQVKPYADDPLILGFAMADVPTMTDSESQWSGLPTWPRVLRNMGAEAPGKRAYVAMMKERHDEIGTFNSAYGTAFDSWDALSAAEDWRPKTDMANKTERADNMAFLRKCVDTYYRVAKETLRRYDTNHMFFGDKTNANGDAFDNIADIAARYCDVTYFQSYGRWSHAELRYDRWSAMTGLPLLNGDSSYGAPKQHMPNPGGTKVRDEAERAAATREFCENAFARPDFVGWHICGILEMWDTMPGQQQRQKIGLKSPTGEFCPEITATLQDISARLYQIGSGQKPRRISPERYKEMFLELGFNTAGFNKYLKYKQRPRSERHLPALFAWFQEHNIPVRGHCLMWPGGVWMNFMPPELSELVYVPDPSIDWRSLKKGVPRKDLTPSEKQAIRDQCRKMIEQASRQWPVFEWDVINEPRDNHVVQDLVGKDVIVDWFRVARQNTMDRDAGLYLNEYRIISDPSPEVITSNMKQYEEEIRYLLDHEAPISGIGFQSRFHAQTTPETLYKRLCYFERFNLPYAATEFEMDDTVGSELDRAAMTERAMTVLFSHRLVNGIYAWSLLAQDQGGPGHRAILEDDGRLKLRGEVWMYLMKNRWWTDATLTTDANGMVTLRGFKGRYKVAIGTPPTAKSVPLDLVEDQETEVNLRLIEED